MEVYIKGTTNEKKKKRQSLKFFNIQTSEMYQGIQNL